MIPGQEWRGPQPCLLADLHMDLQYYDEVKRHKFGSVDYNWYEKKIFGQAILTRQPFLNLGPIPYEAKYRRFRSSSSTRCIPKRERRWKKLPKKWPCMPRCAPT